jgi:bacillithiol biosynthesis cysteine-adding enzyme BshC
LLLSSGEGGLIPDCISFRSIPHTTKLFADFLSHSPEIQRFFPYSFDPSHIAQRAENVPHGSEIHRRVADALERQNRNWGGSEKTLANIQRLREGAHAIVTGQQAGLFGGPLMSLLKAATVLSLAKQVKSEGAPCVPVFWMATEDHDLAEVNEALLLDSSYDLKVFAATSEGKADAPVANVRFATGTHEIVEQAAQLLGDSPIAEYMRESYREGETFSAAYAQLMTRIFAEHGLILLDPADAELHKIAAPLFVEAIDRAGELDEALLAQNNELSKAGYHEQVKVTAESTPLFALVDGARVPVHRANGQFSIRKQRLAVDELKRRIADEPQNFNANVLLRPVLQDYWLPTLAYVGGPAEIAYFAQVRVVYQKLLERETPILPRMSVTLLEPKIEKLLDKYQLNLEDLFHGETVLRDELAKHSLPQELKLDFERGLLAVDEAMQRISESLHKLDPTLVGAARNAANRMRYQVGRLEERAAQAEVRKEEILSRHAAMIENALFPNKTLQEREIAGVYFLARFGLGLIDQLIEAAEARCPEHKILRVG